MLLDTMMYLVEFCHDKSATCEPPGMARRNIKAKMRDMANSSKITPTDQPQEAHLANYTICPSTMMNNGRF